MDERLLKRALTKYNENKKIKKDLEERLEVAEHKLYKGSGGWVAKMPEGAPPDAGLVFAVKLECVDKIRADLKRVNDEIEEVDNFMKVLSEMDDYRSIIEDKFVNELSCEDLADKYGYSTRHINRVIDRIVITGSMLESMDNS